MRLQQRALWRWSGAWWGRATALLGRSHRAFARDARAPRAAWAEKPASGPHERWAFVTLRCWSPGERDGIDRFSSYIVVFVLPPALDTRCGQATF